MLLVAQERLQRILARAGLGSRRACEQLLREGRVRLNGEAAALGQKANWPEDRIEVDGRPLSLSVHRSYIALNKPRGVVSTLRPQRGQRGILDLVNHSGRLFPVGRLDADSEGLILLTDDGDLAQRLTHPRYGHEKGYRVLVASQPTGGQLDAWRRGVVMPDGRRSAPAQVRVERGTTGGTWLRVILREGRKRQIRETGAALGLPVERIVRVRIGTLRLGSLKPGQHRALSAQEVRELKVESGIAVDELPTEISR